MKNFEGVRNIGPNEKKIASFSNKKYMSIYNFFCKKIMSDQSSESVNNFNDMFEVVVEVSRPPKIEDVIPYYY